jgi:hypothetical protein
MSVHKFNATGSLGSPLSAEAFLNGFLSFFEEIFPSLSHQGGDTHPAWPSVPENREAL